MEYQGQISKIAQRQLESHELRRVVQCVELLARPLFFSCELNYIESLPQEQCYLLLSRKAELRHSSARCLEVEIDVIIEIKPFLSENQKGRYNRNPLQKLKLASLSKSNLFSVKTKKKGTRGIHCNLSGKRLQ